MGQTSPNRSTTHTQDLLERVRAATGPDREIDGRIMFELFAKPAGDRGFIWPEDNPSWSFALIFAQPPSEEHKARERRSAAREHETPKEWIGWLLPDGRWLQMNDLRVPRLTASLDAALGLVERVRPGGSWAVDNVGRANGEKMGVCGGHLRCHETSSMWFDTHGFGATPPLALLAALLVALGVGGETTGRGLNPTSPEKEG